MSFSSFLFTFVENPVTMRWLFGSRFMKYTGWILILTGIPALILDHSAGSSAMLLFGLFFVFISKVKSDDERSISLRFSSMTLGFIVAFLTAHLTQYFFETGMLKWRLVEISHFSILVFALALSIFYTRLYFIKE